MSPAVSGGKSSVDKGQPRPAYRRPSSRAAAPAADRAAAPARKGRIAAQGDPHAEHQRIEHIGADPRPATSNGRRRTTPPHTLRRKRRRSRGSPAKAPHTEGSGVPASCGLAACRPSRSTAAAGSPAIPHRLLHSPGAGRSATTADIQILPATERAKMTKAPCVRGRHTAPRPQGRSPPPVPVGTTGPYNHGHQAGRQIRGAGSPAGAPVMIPPMMTAKKTSIPVTPFSP